MYCMLAESDSQKVAKSLALPRYADNFSGSTALRMLCMHKQVEHSFPSVCEKSEARKKQIQSHSACTLHFGDNECLYLTFTAGHASSSKYPDSERTRGPAVGCCLQLCG